MFNLLKKMRAAKAARAAPAPDPAADATAARNVAFLAHRRALATGDTQVQHHTRAALMRATHEVLRLEVRS